MFKSIKKGFGMTVGAVFAYSLIGALSEIFIERVIAQDDEYMEKIKKTNPETYKKWSKYRKEEKES